MCQSPGAVAGEAVVSMSSHEHDASLWSSVCAALDLRLPAYMDATRPIHCAPAEFTVRSTWPIVPNDWVLGEVTSISVDRNDDIWALHVPQSIPEDKRANAAPPALRVRLPRGNRSTSLGWTWRTAPSWLGREHGISLTRTISCGWRACRLAACTAPGGSDDMITKFTMSGVLGAHAVSAAA